jgi:hypothetical protein
MWLYSDLRHFQAQTMMKLFFYDSELLESLKKKINLSNLNLEYLPKNYL